MSNKRPGGESFGRSQDLPENVRSVNLGPIKFKLAQDESPVNWTRDQINIVEEEYRKFLALAVLNPEEKIVPSGPVDTFWHFHIVDTEKYAEDCIKIFGRFLHHFPYLGLRGEEDKKVLNNQWEKTLKIYKKIFGEPPQNTWEVMADCGRTGCAVGPPTA